MTLRAAHMSPGQRGFSLAEVVVAVAILGMIGLLTFGTFARAMDARDQAEAITGHYHQVRQGMLRMSREIQMAYISEHRDCDDERTRTIFKAGSASGGMRLDFTSFSHFKMAADANESDQNELAYFLGAHPDDATRTALFRREDIRVDDEPEEGGVEQVLIEDAVSIEFSFYDPKEDRWESDWDTDDRDYKGRLPMFVSIELEMKGPDGEKEKFYTKTRIFLRKSIRILGTGFAPCID